MRGLPFVLQIGQASRWMFSDKLPVTAVGAASSAPPPTPSGQHPGRMDGPGAVQPAGLVLVGVSQRLPEQMGVVLGPGPGRPTALPLGLDPATDIEAPEERVTVT